MKEFSRQVMGDHPLGRPIGGTPESIRGVPREAVWQHYQTHYQPQGLLVTAAGEIEHEQVCELVAKALSNGGWNSGAQSPLPMRPNGQATGSWQPIGADRGAWSPSADRPSRPT